MSNVAVLRGHLSRPAEERVQSPSGRRVLHFDLTVRGERAGPARSVPVAWPDPPGPAGVPGPGDEVVVVGQVSRRFFRAGGATQSRTEVVASSVVPAHQTRRAARALGRALAVVEAAAPRAREPVVSDG